MLQLPDIAISYDERISDDTFDDFVSLIDKNGLSFAKESREQGYFAGIEWLLPTMIIIFISRSYFDSFLREMGKDHYTLLKKGISLLRKKIWGIKVVTVCNPPDKISKEPSFSFLFSIMSKTKDDKTVKFLFDENASAENYEEIIDAFLTLLSEHYSSHDDDYLSIELKKLNKTPHTILIRYNTEKKKPEIIDPM